MRAKIEGRGLPRHAEYFAGHRRQQTPCRGGRRPHVGRLSRLLFGGRHRAFRGCQTKLSGIRRRVGRFVGKLLDFNNN